MFQCRNYRIWTRQVSTTHPTHQRTAQYSRQHGVFTIRFLHPRPTRLTRQIQHWAVTDMRPLQTQFLTYHPPHACYQLRIESCRLADACRENGCTDSHVSVGSLFGQKDGNAQTGFLNGIALQLVGNHSSGLRVKPVLYCLLGPRVGPKRGPKHAGTAFVYLSFVSIGASDILFSPDIHFPT